MFKIISNREIHITRGDSALIENIIIRNPDGSEYDIKEGDVIEFTVKERATVKHSDPLIHKVGIPIKFEPEDTKDMRFADYVFDVQLTQENGDVSTVIGCEKDDPTIFRILPEVTE